MTTAILKEQRINIAVSSEVVIKLKQMTGEKLIPSMSKFCQEAINEKLERFEREQKNKLMEFAAQDEDYQERCKTIQAEFAAIDYSNDGGNEEW